MTETNGKRYQVAFGGRTLAIREPRHGELDLGLLKRLHVQMGLHFAHMDQVDPDAADAALQVDRYVQLGLRAAEEIARRVRTCLLACAVEVDGAPAEDGALGRLLQEPDDMNAAEYMGASEALLSQLHAEAGLGESSRRSG